VQPIKELSSAAGLCAGRDCALIRQLSNRNATVCLAYFRELEDRKMTAAEMKSEVEVHLKKKVAIESVLPPNIVIGPFYVSTDGVRQGIIKKHRTLATAVLELLAKKLRMQAEEVSAELFVRFAIGGAIGIVSK